MIKQFKHGHKTIGTLDTSRNTLTKDVKKSKHLFRKAEAWGIDNSMLEELPAHCVVVLNESEEQKKYKLNVSEIRAKGFFLHYLDDGLQRFVKLSDWRVEEPKHLTPEQEAEEDYRRASGLPPKYL